MRKNQPRPWLSPTRVEIPTSQLKEISISWDADTWERYLKWFESGRREPLLNPHHYDELVERQTESIFQKLSSSPDEADVQLCEELLRMVPEKEARVLRFSFLEGKTVREIAAIENKAKSTIHDLKNRALFRIQRGHAGENPDTRRLMRGASSTTDQGNDSPWVAPLSLPIREDRVYDPSQYKEEIAKINSPELKAAMQQLSEREQRILYLRFWCDLSIPEIASQLRFGVNLIEQVIDAAISKLKRKMIQIKTGYLPGEGPSCA